MQGRSSPEHSRLKLYGSETLQDCLAAGMEAQGPDGLDTRILGPSMWRDGSWATQWLRSFAGTIPGGTREIQRNIISARAPGLPRKSKPHHPATRGRAMAVTMLSYAAICQNQHTPM